MGFAFVDVMYVYIALIFHFEHEKESNSRRLFWPHIRFGKRCSFRGISQQPASTGAGVLSFYIVIIVLHDATHLNARTSLSPLHLRE